MSECPRPSVYTLPFGRDLCDETVDLVFRMVGNDPLALSDAIIFLPNNRAITAMQEAFVRRAEPGLLMPRLTAIGDLALDETLGPLINPIDDGDELPALIPPLQRQLLLAQMVTVQRRRQGDALEVTEAMRLARLLAELIDELDIEQRSFSDFQALSGEREITEDPELATHWQSSYAGLLEILPKYRAKMAEIGMDGPAARRNILLGRLAARLRAQPPTGPIFASGISTAAPAIANLLKVVALLPDGHVILPPIDLAMADDDWQILGPIEPEGRELPTFGKETHPQFHLKLLIERMGINRAEIQRIGGEEASGAAAIAQIFCLPSASKDWSALPNSAKQMPNLRAMTAEDSAEEARAVAILVRKALQQPEKRIAIVTPDRELAVRISGQLARWGIHVDDSAGTPILQTPAGTLIMALLNAAAQRFSPAELLAVAKHPLVQAGEERVAWLAGIRALDLKLRGPAEGVGLGAISRHLQALLADERQPEKREKLETIIAWWEGFSAMLQPLDKAASSSFSKVLGMLVPTLNALSNNSIWRGAAGRQLSSLFESFAAQNFDILGPLRREILPNLFSELCHAEVTRPPYGGHPRVALLGLLEARLQQADLMICAGLNEGSWPQLPSPDPWLAPRIRRQLRLTGLERNIGLSAHDLSTALGAPECVITRAKRDRSGPAVSSRFLLRIEAFLAANIEREDDALIYARSLDLGKRERFAPAPKICPTADQRRVDMSVTNFDELMADPFAFYAKKILKISPLGEVEEDPGPAWRGTMIHDLLEDWTNEDDCAPEKLIERANDMLFGNDLHPRLRIFWQPRITAALRWVAQETSDLSARGRTWAVAESSGNIKLDGINITGRADRVDRNDAGDLIIIDYKTGNPPAPKQIRAGFALQLGLLGLMAERGAFKDRDGIQIDGNATSFEYWSFAKNGDKFGKRIPAEGGKKSKHGEPPVAADELVPMMHSKALEAIGKWITGEAPFESKLRPEFAPYEDFDQLSRRQEWDGRQSVKQDGDS